jgi:hypothetical protein
MWLCIAFETTTADRDEAIGSEQLASRELRLNQRGIESTVWLFGEDYAGASLVEAARPVNVGCTEDTRAYFACTQLHAQCIF